MSWKKYLGFPEPRDNNFKFSNRSKNNLQGVHEDLILVAARALELTEVDFGVTEGLRSRMRQRELVNEGKSQTMNSRHLTGHAIDVVPYVGGKVSWNWDHFYPVADAFIKAADELDIPLRWGGNWRVHDVRAWESTARELNRAYTGSFHDGPHFELPKRYYP